uniref:Tetraspanin 4a n=1 Tax=Astyanax mexicanus TaxID=7994 RepID=A0A8B9LQ67_ASTMX
MAEGCMRALRYAMVFFNLLFWLGGCGILGVGVWLSVTQGNFATLSSSLPSLSAANLLIAMGTIIMVIGCLGCVGAVKESRPLLLSFFVLLLLIFFLEILFIILFFAYQDQVRNLLCSLLFFCVFLQPCYERVKGWLQENLVALWIFALCAALTQILGLVFSMTMFCQTVKVDTFYA